MKRTVLKLLFVFFSLCFSFSTYTERIGQFSSVTSLVLYQALLFASIACIVVASFTRDNALRIVSASLLGSACVAGVAFAHATSAQWVYFDFVTLVDARSATVDASNMFMESILVGVSAGLLLAAGVGLHPNPRFSIVNRWAAICPLAFLASLSTMLVVRNGDGAGGLPPAWTGLGYAALYVFDTAQGNTGSRSEVKIARKEMPKRRDIVLIIDESVAGHYLDINSPAGARSGLKESTRPNVKIHNFGMATSITNCSMGSNVALRFGGTRNEYQRIISRMPSIWSYAKAAGFRTVHLYAQRGDKNQNYMTQAERENIDSTVRFEQYTDISRDQRVAETLAALIDNNSSEFILVNKMGSHFPVHTSYPASYTQYRPALPRARVWKDGDDSQENRRSIIYDQQDWAAYRNSYGNTLTWTVGAFFDKLFASTSLKNSTIIYTSDHGQTFHERGKAGLTTHCQSNPEIEEGIVPMVVIEGDQMSTFDWQKAVVVNHNRMSHYRIFPTILSLMGYEQKAVSTVYGADMFSPVPDPFTFAVEFHLRLGRKPRWVYVALEKVAYPTFAPSVAKR